MTDDQEQTPSNNEMVKLVQRIREQSDLIMVLKDRADKELFRSKSLSSEVENLETKLLQTGRERDAITDSFKAYKQQMQAVEQNFDSVVEESMEWKDDHDKLLHRYERLQSRMAETVELERRKIQSQVDAKLRNYDSLVEENRTLRKLNDSMKETSSRTLNELRDWREKFTVLEDRNSQLESQLEEVRRLEGVRQKTEEMSQENKLLSEQLSKLQRTCEALEATVNDKDASLAEMERELHQLANLNAKQVEEIRRLGEELNEHTAEEQNRRTYDELKAEYDAFKEYSQELLRLEQETTKKLRKLYH